MDGRGERIGVNEAIFREVNERIEDLAETFDLKVEPLDLVCECGNADCVNRITMTIAEYEAVRSESRQFAVFPGHEVPDLEDVIAERRSYNVVRKSKGAPEQVAEQTDPRR
jgi:hypothetical protein